MAYSRSRSSRFCRGRNPPSDAVALSYITGKHGEDVIRAMGMTPAKFPDDPTELSYSMQDLPGIPAIYKTNKEDKLY